MPFAQIYMLEGRTPEQKKALAQALTEATVKTLGVKPDGVDVMFFDVARHDWATAGVPWSERAPAPPKAP